MKVKVERVKVSTVLSNKLGKRKNIYDGAFFYGTKKALYNYFLNNKDYVYGLKNGENIDLKNIIPVEEEEFLNRIINSNRGCFEEGDELSSVLVSEISDEIKELFVKLKNNELVETKVLRSDSRSSVFKGAREANEGDLINDISSLDTKSVYLVPEEDMDFNYLLLNFFQDSTVKYLFNKSFDVEPMNLKSSIGTKLFEVMSLNGSVELPTRYKSICTHKDGGVECGNVVYFSEVHKSSKITCTDSLEPSQAKALAKKTHSIKNIDKAEPVMDDVIKLFIYNVRCKVDEDDGKTYLLYSLFELNDYVVKGNVVGGANFNILISNESFVNKDKLKKNFLIADKNNYSFLNDLFLSSKEYLKRHHGIKLTNANKIVGEVLIFQWLCNHYFDFAWRAAIFGTSGSGKSFYRRVLLPLFTNSIAEVDGGTVTRNRLKGGRSNYATEFMNSLFQPGFVATHEIVWLEEMTNTLLDFAEPNRFGVNLNNNPWSLLKGLDYKFQEFDVGIQGSEKSHLKASVVKIGNLEQLTGIREKYLKLVRDKYKSLNTGGGANFNSNWPLYKPVEWYSTHMGNENLALSHSSVRRSLLNKHYVTFLPEAEMQRITWLLVLEDFESGMKPVSLNRDIYLSKYVHREDIRSELDKKFLKENDEKFKLPKKLYDAVGAWMNEEYFVERNNFVIDRSRDYYRHLRLNIINLAAHMVFMNKLYWRSGDDDVKSFVLTDDDKVFIRFYLLFNYNTLGVDEAAMIKKPFINDLIYDADVVMNRIDESAETKELIKRVKEEARRGVDLKQEFSFDEFEVVDDE